MYTHPSRSRRAFTLIELLVVIAIIALLISILVPVLSAARKIGQATACAANLHHIGQAMGGYLGDNSGVYPPAYIYPYNDLDYDLNHQEDMGSTNPTFGYLHWSYFLYGNVDVEAFRCPTIPNGGLPRTNPGNNQTDWETGQVDQNGQSAPNPFQDRQAARIAYAGNAAIFPRNKFSSAMSGGPRTNRCVNEKEIASASTILLAELNKNWKTVAQGGDGNGLLVKSHRPLNPFYNISSGTNEFGSAPETPGFTYGDAPYYGLLPGAELNVSGIVDGSSTIETNAVGRHHPGSDSYIGGSANFLYADSHVERKSVLETVKHWEWGNKFYSVTGNSKIGPPW